MGQVDVKLFEIIPNFQILQHKGEITFNNNNKWKSLWLFISRLPLLFGSFQTIAGAVTRHKNPKWWRAGNLKANEGRTRLGVLSLTLDGIIHRGLPQVSNLQLEVGVIHLGRKRERAVRVKCLAKEHKLIILHPRLKT